jgi:hypothetical protein
MRYSMSETLACSKAAMKSSVLSSGGYIVRLVEWKNAKGHFLVDELVIDLL